MEIRGCLDLWQAHRCVTWGESRFGCRRAVGPCARDSRAALHRPPTPCGQSFKHPPCFSIAARQVANICITPGPPYANRLAAGCQNIRQPFQARLRGRGCRRWRWRVIAPQGRGCRAAAAIAHSAAALQRRGLAARAVRRACTAWRHRQDGALAHSARIVTLMRTDLLRLAIAETPIGAHRNRRRARFAGTLEGGARNPACGLAVRSR